MKKVLFFILAVVLFVSCEKNELGNYIEDVSGSQFTATIEQFDGSENTKTSLSAQNMVLWSEGDELAIFQGATLADKYRVKLGTAGTSNGVFSVVPGASGSINGDFMSGTEVPVNIAVYPYENDLEIFGIVAAQEEANAAYTISNITIPSEQVYVANSFAQEAFPMVAVTSSISDHALKFRNVLGAVKLQLLGNCTVKSIKLEGNKGEILAGDAKVTAFGGDGVPGISMLDGGSTSIVLDCGNGVQLNNETATEFIIAVPPTKFEEGFTVTITDTDDCAIEISTTSQNEVLRSHILKMPERNIFESGYIKFHDELVKELCIDAFDTNDDGELSYEEAAAVTDLEFNQLRFQYTGITSFNEFKYFSTVTTIDNSKFMGCEQLTSILLPQRVVSLGHSVFSGCVSLNSVNIPSGVTVIESSMFDGCSSLASVTIPEGVTCLENFAFSDCSSLASVILPESITSLCNYVFDGCTSLTSITLPSSITSIGSAVFRGCASLTSVIIPEGVTYIGGEVFQRCTSLVSVTIPEGISTIQSFAFSECTSLTSVTIPEGVTFISYEVFRDCTSLTSVTLPLSLKHIGSQAFQGCTSLASVTLPENIECIETQAFYDCIKLTDIYCYAIAVPQLEGNRFMGNINFYNNAADRIIYVPAQSVDAYKAAAGWSTYASAIQAMN